jgi:hypothetical protein
MNSTATLTGSHLRTYNTIFQHPVSHNLQWHDVYALFRHLGTVEEETNGNLKVTCNGQNIVLHPPRTKDVGETDEVMGLRHFLERSDPPVVEEGDKNTHWLLVIDHHQARIFRSEIQRTTPERVHPHESDRYFRHARNSMNLSKGKEKPESNSYFEPVARALRTFGEILVFGTGTGMSSEMDQFIAWAKTHHPELAKRIIGSVVVDEHHLTEAQLLAKAREFYAAPRKSHS